MADETEKARRMVDVIFGPCTRDEAESCALIVQQVFDERFPELGAAVAVKYEVEDAGR